MYMDKTLREMLENPLVSEIAPDAISKWDLSKEEFYGWTLQEIADRMGWGCLERGFKRLFKAAEGEVPRHCPAEDREKHAYEGEEAPCSPPGRMRQYRNVVRRAGHEEESLDPREGGV